MCEKGAQVDIAHAFDLRLVLENVVLKKGSEALPCLVWELLPAENPTDEAEENLGIEWMYELTNNTASQWGAYNEIAASFLHGANLAATFPGESETGTLQSRLQSCYQDLYLKVRNGDQPPKPITVQL